MPPSSKPQIATLGVGSLTTLISSRYSVRTDTASTHHTHPDLGPQRSWHPSLDSESLCSQVLSCDNLMENVLLR